MEFGNINANGEGFSAMARTVGYPVAIAAKLLLDGISMFTFIILGIIKEKGVVGPMKIDTYKPMLHELTRIPIEFYESIHSTETI